jgi:hypothetical protein
MNWAEYMRGYSHPQVGREFDRHLREIWPQLNPQTQVALTPLTTIHVQVGQPPKWETERVYSPRLDFKGRLLLALGALFDVPKWWNQGFTPSIQPKLSPSPTPTLTVELQRFGVQRSYTQDSAYDARLIAGYCAYNDTLYIRR